MKRIMNRFITAFLIFALCSSSFSEEGIQRTKSIRLSPKVVQSINKGLEYIAKTQNPNGGFGKSNITGATSLALMAYMLQGHIPGEGKYGKQMSKAVDYLLSVEKNGYFHDETSRGMYEHGLAVLALSEVWGQSYNPKIRDALKRGVNVILNAQNSEGGWRYAPRPTSADSSCSAMQIVALASAKEAGIAVPHKVMKKALDYLIACEVRSTGGFSYQLLAGAPMGGAGPARTAAATLALILGGERNHPATKGGLAFLNSQPKSYFTGGKSFHYAHYYGAQVMYQNGDKHFNRYYTLISESLLAQQGKDGSYSGYGDGVIRTGFAILILGVPYRFLPIYQK